MIIETTPHTIGAYLNNNIKQPTADMVEWCNKEYYSFDIYEAKNISFDE